MTFSSVLLPPRPWIQSLPALREGPQCLSAHLLLPRPYDKVGFVHLSTALQPGKARLGKAQPDVEYGTATTRYHSSAVMSVMYKCPHPFQPLPTTVLSQHQASGSDPQAFSRSLPWESHPAPHKNFDRHVVNKQRNC